MKKVYGILVLVLICSINLIADLNDGLMLYYPFSGNANDESGNNNNGTVNGAELTTDRLENENSAYNLDGVNDHILCPADASIALTNSLTIDFWIYPTNWGEHTNNGDHLGYGRIFDKATVKIFPHNTGYSDYNQQCLIFHLIIGGTEYAAITPSQSIVLNQWQHINLSYTDSSVKIMINGVAQTLSYLNGNIPNGNIDDNSGNNLYIGEAASMDRAIPGKIDEVRIYNRVLSEDEKEELYFGFIANFSSAEESYVGESIQFTDISTGNPTTWEWDFENDGIYDSFVRNPTHIYNSEGIYSVKLKITKETSIDSLIKENHISVTYCPPVSPQVAVPVISGNNAIISWTEADSTICGTPIVPDGYVVLFSEIPNQDDYFFFLASTIEIFYTHINVVRWSDEMFYKIFAYKDYSRDQIEYLKSLNNSGEKIKWPSVQQNLDRMRK